MSNQEANQEKALIRRFKHEDPTPSNDVNERFQIALRDAYQRMKDLPTDGYRRGY